MSCRSIIPASALIACAALAAGCRPTVPDNGSFAGSVLVRPVRGHPQPSHLARTYGPRVAVLRHGLEEESALSGVLFEIDNLDSKAVDWVAWNHSFDRQEAIVSPWDGQARFLPYKDRRCCLYVGRIEPGQNVMCSVGLDENGIRVAGWSGGRVMGVLAGTGQKPPKADIVAARYTGSEWLVSDDKFVRNRLDGVLGELRAGDPGKSWGVLKALVDASRLVNDGLPVVKKPEIVAAFAETVLRVKPRHAPTAADDEAPEPRAISLSELADPFEYALLVLLDLVPPKQLKPHADALGALAAHAGDRRVVELLIKAGSAKALAALAADPARLPEDGRRDLALAALAGSGDARAFTEFLARFKTEKDVRSKARQARLLGLLGREEGLKALAGEVRSTARGIGQEYGFWNVKGAAVDALRLAFPEEPGLYADAEPLREEMIWVEEFCLRRLGIRFEGPVPGPDRAVDFINQGFGPGLLFSAGLSFGELAFRAIRGGGGGEEDEYIRAILPVRELTYGAREFAALASPGGWRQRYEDALRDRIAKVRAELTAKGFRWKECTLTAACLLPASRADELGKPAKPGLYERLSGGEKFGLAELKPHLEPLKGEDGRAGIVILLLGDGAREAAIRLDTMVTRRGRCVQLLSPVIEVHSVGPASGAGAGAGAKPGEKPVGKPVAPDPAKQP